MSSYDYWKEREEAQRKKDNKDMKSYSAEIKKIYQSMMDQISDEIHAFYSKYASDTGITMAEAIKRANKLDMEEYSRKAKKYVEEKNFSEQANAEMKLYNMTMKVNRLELLKANIGLELVSGHDELEKFFQEELEGKTIEELERLAGILGDSIQNNKEFAESIVNASFHNATFSDRIWMHQDLLKNDISSLLQTSLIQGRNPNVLARDLRRRFNVKISDAERLMRTEMARVQVDAQMRSYLANGIDEYEYIACGGPDVCSVCQALDGKVFKVSKTVPAKNAPPMHPNCHCSTGAHIDNKEYEDWLNFLENGGTTKEWLLSHQERERIKIPKKLSNAPYGVNASVVNSKTYHDKFERLTGHKPVNEAIHNESFEILSDLNATEHEHIVAIDARTGKRLQKNKAAAEAGITFRCGFSDEQLKLLQAKNGVDFVVIHNHPNSSLPSRDDIQSLFERNNQVASVISCHDGTVYYIERLKEYKNIDSYVAKVYLNYKEMYIAYGDVKIEQECSVGLLEALEERGYIRYVKR